MEACLGLSVKTSTPVPYWLTRPILELNEWLQVYMDMCGKGGGSGHGE
jgi:hypothetical protein